MLDQAFAVCFDAAQSVLNGEMSATLVRNPCNTVAIGVEDTVAPVGGGSIDPGIDAGTVPATMDKAKDCR